MATITPFLWFDDDLGEALDLYATLFDDLQVHDRSTYPADAPNGPRAGDLMSATFTIAGQRVMGLNGGPMHSLTEAFSFFVDCDDQAQADRLWEALSGDGGRPSMCGWVTDRFGVTWQLVPPGLMELLSGPTPEAARRASEAMMSMQRLDIEAIRRASEGA